MCALTLQSAYPTMIDDKNRVARETKGTHYITRFINGGFRRLRVLTSVTELSREHRVWKTHSDRSSTPKAQRACEGIGEPF